MCSRVFQLTEALSYLHYTHHMLHRHVCPASIFVNKRGVWKLGGLEFTGGSCGCNRNAKTQNLGQLNLETRGKKIFLVVILTPILK